MKLITLLFIFLFSVSCSNMINGYYRELDKGHRKRRSTKVTTRSQTKYTPISSSKRVLLPPTQRLYIEQQKRRIKQRVTANNFTTSSNQADLWSNPESADLYTTNSSVSSGDIVIINVLKDLKSDIAKELKRAFRSRKRKSKKQITKAPSTDPTKVQNGLDTEQTDTEQQIYDRISSIVIDTVSNNYVSIKGRKELLYKNKKHSIEIQALVNKKDIDSNNYIKSSDIIEKTIRVLY